MTQPIASIFTSLKSAIPLAEKNGLAVRSPHSGEMIAQLREDTQATLGQSIFRARTAQAKWQMLKRSERVKYVEAFAAALKANREALAECIHLEGGKTMKEALGEVDSSADVLLKTIKDTTLPEFNGMMRVKERPPVGVVGLITSFNFPMVVAHWTLAPALLAANAVVWKPSEKTPLSALAVKTVFDRAFGEYKDLLQIAIGGRAIGQALVAHEGVNMISATGSVAMGRAIKETLAKKSDNAAPILELGGNNGAIISDKVSPEHLEWSVSALMGSFLGTTGQRCTNTRRLIVHASIYDKTVSLFKTAIETFLAGDAKNPDNAYGYAALIDEDAFKRFERAKKHAVEEGGEILLGNRLQNEYPNAFYVEPALALLPGETAIMHEETFAPILFIAPYTSFDKALVMLNAPRNAGLVGAIYTQNQAEADRFAAACEAGHCLINPPKGTGTPAHGMGFGGNKDSGCGEILNAADPLAAFTRPDKFTRIAMNKDVVMNF